MSHYSAEFHGTFRFQILYKKLRKLYAKVLNSSCRTVFQFVNYSSLWTLTVWIFWQLQFHSTNQIIWTILTRIWIAYFSVLNESIELLTTLSFALEIKSILKLKVMCGEFNGFSIILQLEKYYSIFNKYSNMYGKCREWTCFNDVLMCFTFLKHLSNKRLWPIEPVPSRCTRLAPNRPTKLIGSEAITLANRFHVSRAYVQL